MATKIDIVNAALTMMGGVGSLTSFSDTTREAEVARRIYEPTRDALLTQHSWRFTIKRDSLVRTTNTPEYDWEYEFQLPTDHMVILGTQNKEPFEIAADKLLTDVNSIKIIYQYAATEGEFPSYFVQTLQYKLATLFAVALAEDEGKAQFFQSMYDKQLQLAMAKDSGQRSSVALDTNKLIYARRGRP